MIVDIWSWSSEYLELSRLINLIEKSGPSWLASIGYSTLLVLDESLFSRVSSQAYEL